MMRLVLGPWLRIVEKEMYTHFASIHTELTYAILFPFLLVWTMDLGIGGSVSIGGVSYVTYIAPGIMLMSVLTTAFFNTGFIMLFEKEYSGSFEGLITCPVSSHDVVFGKVLSGAIKSTVTGLLIIVVLVLSIGYTPPWTIWLTPIPLFVAGLLFSAIGITFGVVIKKGYQLGSIGNMVVFPLTFFGGIFFDVETLPGGLAAVARLSPVTALVDSSRSLMVYGSLEHTGWSVAMGLAFFVVFYLIAVKIFEREVLY